MPLLRRLSALLTGLLLAQLTLLDGHWSCASHQSGQRHASMATTVAHLARAATSAPSSHDPCGTERLPGDCTSMPTCATALSLPAASATRVARVLAPVAPPDLVALSSRPAAGPDVPPPRG
jgi:hypothetical protein